MLKESLAKNEIYDDKEKTLSFTHHSKFIIKIVI